MKTSSKSQPSSQGCPLYHVFFNSSDEGEDNSWDALDQVPYTFVKTVKSKKEKGEFLSLMTWKETRGAWWYNCSEKITRGCPANATVKRLETISENGEVSVVNSLVSVSSPQVHSPFHLPDCCAIIADSLVEMMKKEIKLEC